MHQDDVTALHYVTNIVAMIIMNRDDNDLNNNV